MLDRVAVHDNFFDLGGHSLLIMQAIAKLETRTGKRLNPRTFIFQTLAQIASEYDNARAGSTPPARRSAARSGTRRIPRPGPTRTREDGALA